MNCTQLFLKHSQEIPKKTALWLPGYGETSYGELRDLAARTQSALKDAKIRPGDTVLLFDQLSPRLYALIIGLLGSGATVMFVEPWMPLPNIEHVVNLAQPKLFLGNWLGFAWGLRSRAIRKIPQWKSIGNVMRQGDNSRFHLEEVNPDLPGILTFTSGTTGKPKGVVRTQGYLVEQHRVLSKSLEVDKYPGPDLAIFANFVLSNLAAGRSSVIVPSSWKPKHLKALMTLPEHLQPETLTTGPAFLLKLMALAPVPSLKSIHVGGALTDCAIFEKAFETWPAAHVTHLYGSSEVEPIAHADAKESVRLSKARGLFQALFLGHPVPEIKEDFSKADESGLWVTGPHVCPKYLGNEEENKKYKFLDDQGHIWHCTGDRIKKDANGYWFAGRSGQPPELFELEQAVYSYTQSSKSFVHFNAKGELWLVGEKLKLREAELRQKFPTLAGVAEAKIIRDNRHRARIDRLKTLKKGAPWLVGSPT